MVLGELLGNFFGVRATCLGEKCAPLVIGKVRAHFLSVRIQIVAQLNVVSTLHFVLGDKLFVFTAADEPTIPRQT